MRGGEGPRMSPRTEHRGQSGIIGTVLILALTLIGATAVMAFGATVLNDARVDSQEGGIEHAMTQLDSRSAMVALGDSGTQRVPLGATGSGGYRIDADSGWMNITHHEFNETTGESEVIYNESLGALVYEKGDKTIAYQGGGVWVATSNTSRMISPPEFHYQSATLTLPVIRVEGSSSAAGTGTIAEVTQISRARAVYPNLSRSYPSPDGPFTNPIREGNVTVTVKSDFYKAWADYFRTRTSGEVSVDHANETATVNLIALGVTGDFEMPADGNSIEIRGLGGGHSIDKFEITLFSDDQDSADFSNLKWSFHAEKGGQQIEMHLRDESGGSCDDAVRATVYYTENTGADYQSWTNGTAFQYECESDAGEDFNGDGDQADKRLVVNLTSATPMEYARVQGGPGVIMSFSVSGSDNFVGSTTFDEHEDAVSWESKTFSSGESTSIDNVTNHYLSLMGPDVELTVEDANGNTVNEDASNGIFEQSGGGGQFITFLHITENRVSIELE